MQKVILSSQEVCQFMMISERTLQRLIIGNVHPQKIKIDGVGENIC